jgi:hypothetical protein
MDAEGAVRLYLLALEDPSKLRDDAKIKKLEAQVASAKDPIDKLKAYAELERAEAVDISGYRADFVKNARSWAQANGVSAAAFAALGVPAEDLRAAGIIGGGRARSRSTAPAGPRRSRVTIEDIKARIPAGPFTVKQLEAASGGSPGTVRKAISELLAAGGLEDLGSDPGHASRGKAPTLYRRT